MAVQKVVVPFVQELLMLCSLGPIKTAPLPFSFMDFMKNNDYAVAFYPYQISSSTPQKDFRNFFFVIGEGDCFPNKTKNQKYFIIFGK